MEAKINQVGILTGQFEQMVAFYNEVLGFRINLRLEGHAEFESPGVRFAIGTLKIMTDITDHSSFAEKKKGQSFELAFAVPSPSDVDKTYDEIVKKGADAIQQWREKHPDKKLDLPSPSCSTGPMPSSPTSTAAFQTRVPWSKPPSPGTPANPSCSTNSTRALPSRGMTIPCSAV